MKYGLIGEKLGHSFSVPIHNAFGNSDYVLKEIPKGKLPDFMKAQDFEGINVTIPYKQDVMPYCILDDAAKEIGAVNTIVKRNGKLYGYNTDAFGLSALIDKTLCEGIGEKEFTNGESAVILGAGGTCKTAIYVLKQKKVSSIYVLARDAKKAEKTLAGKNVKVFSIEKNENGNYPECIRNAAILINTTPVGMYPKADNMPVDLHQFTKLQCVFDVVYNPLTTRLVDTARQMGIPAKNGLYMLVMQAVKAEALFFEDKDNGLINLINDIPEKLSDKNSGLHNENIDSEKLSKEDREIVLRKVMKEAGDRVYHDILCKQENIVLIGMPGSGKSTVGQLLAKEMNRDFVDTDTEFEKTYSMTPAACIENEGEEEFRKKETEVVRTVTSKNSLVIATGGGVVTRPENVKLCKQNGKVIYIKRDISNLSSEGRPLSKGDGAIERLYESRKHLYEGAADYIVEVTEGKPEDAADFIFGSINSSK